MKITLSSRKAYISAIALFMALGFSLNLLAQAVSIASVTGRVVDDQGAVLAGARIRLAGTENGSVYTAVANGEGLYTIPNVPIGAYTLEAAAQGFQTYVQKGLELRVGDAAQLDIQMKVGSVSER